MSTEFLYSSSLPATSGSLITEFSALCLRFCVAFIPALSGNFFSRGWSVKVTSCTYIMFSSILSLTMLLRLLSSCFTLLPLYSLFLSLTALDFVLSVIHSIQLLSPSLSTPLYHPLYHPSVSSSPLPVYYSEIHVTYRNVLPFTVDWYHGKFLRLSHYNIMCYYCQFQRL